jgi:hypothetical protein
LMRKPGDSRLGQLLSHADQTGRRTPIGTDAVWPRPRGPDVTIGRERVRLQ